MHRLILRALLPFVFASLAQAQGLVQLTLGGNIHLRGGAHVEIEVGARIDGSGRQVELALHLAQGTSGSDVAQLVTARLTRAGFDVLAPAPRSTAHVNAHVFVEDAYFVRLRLSGGLTGIITTSDGPPAEVRIEAAEAFVEDAKIHVSATARSPHTKKSSHHSFTAGIAAEDHAVQAINKIHQAALEAKWMGDRPTTNAWRPVRMEDGSMITGFSIGFETAGDWRLEVKLPMREAR